MESKCAAPGCQQNGAARLRNEVWVCVNHFWLVRTRLEKLGVDLSHFKGQLFDLLKPEEIWAPIAQSLVAEASLLQRKAQALRLEAREAVDRSRGRRRSQAD